MKIREINYSEITDKPVYLKETSVILIIDL